MKIRDGRLRAASILAVSLALVGCEGSVEEPTALAVEPGEYAPGLSDEERGRFLTGRALFDRLATQDEGLGPLFNAERCVDCHDSPSSGGAGTQILVLKATRYEDGRCYGLREVGGDNIQLRATDLLLAHGLGPETIPAEATDSMYVIAPPLYGLGLIEAVPDSVLERLADPDDRDGDGISGRLPRLADGRSARFGRKGDASDVAGFVDTALRFELGLTTPDNPVEEYVNGVPIPEGADPMPEPEMDAQGFGLLTDYVRFLGAPAPETVTSADADVVRRGEELFDEVGCATCHVPELRTGATDTEALSFQTLRLYSDLLVHDLGDPDGDVCGADVAPGEFRTTPLWGLRHRDRYMNDGTATDLDASISAHGGEAAASRDAFEALSADGQAALLRFLASL
jgi:CxxC motif-containing protein (DUF1111 family)